MGIDALLLLLLLLATLTLFVLEKLPLEVTAMCLLAALLLFRLVSVEEAIAGLSNKAVVTVGGMFVLSHALVRTGSLEIFADWLSQRFGASQWLGIGVLLAVVGLMSGFLNNTAVVAIFIPLAVDLCRRFRLSPSKVLIPLSYAAIFGGTLSLIGTSTNLLVSALSEEAGTGALSMFEFTPLGAVFLVTGLVYVLLLAPRRLPSRASTESLTGKFEMAAYLTELQLPTDSELVGKTLQEAEVSRRYDVTVIAVIREGRRLVTGLPVLVLEAGDVLIVRGAMPNLLHLRDELGVALLSDVKMSDEEVSGGEQVAVEAIIPPASSLIGRTLVGSDFRRHYGAFVLAIRRQESTLRERLAHTPLRFSDTLLLVAPRDRLDDLRGSEDLVLTSELDLHLRRQRFWWLPIPLIPGIMLLAATGAVDILVGVILASVSLLALGVISPREAYRSVDWSVIFFIAAFVPVGDAMFHTGLADLLAEAVLAPGGSLPPAVAPFVAVSLLYLVTSLATETITNNAAAIILTPVAISMAAELGLDAKPFILAICFAASASFMTPTGYQTNMMVYGPGSYRFVDFTRFGAPLNLVFWLVASLLIPWFWPFE